MSTLGQWRATLLRLIRHLAFRLGLLSRLVLHGELVLHHRRRISYVLYCFMLGFNPETRTVYAQVRGIRIFDEAFDGDFQKILAKIDSVGYDRIVNRINQHDLFQHITESGLRIAGEKNLLFKFHRTNIDLIDSKGHVVFRGSGEEATYFLVNQIESKSKLTQLLKAIQKTKNAFDPGSAALTAAGFTGSRLLPVSKNGLSPDFKNVFNLMYKGQYLVYNGNQKFVTVRIKLTGSRNVDFRLAYQEVKLNHRPKGYTWHHLDDFDPETGECTMQLVLTSVHDMANHTGSAALWSRLFEIVYK